MEVDLAAVEHDAAVWAEGDAVAETAASSIEGDAARIGSIDDNSRARASVAWRSSVRSTAIWACILI